MAKNNERKNAMGTLLKIWKTIQIGMCQIVGMYQNADQCRQALEAAGCEISESANDIIGNIDFTTAVKDNVEFVKLHLYDHPGRASGITLQQIFDWAQSMGLEKCHPNDSPVLRIQYTDQPFHEILLVGTDPVVGSDGTPCLVMLHRGNGCRSLLLDTYHCLPDHTWKEDGTTNPYLGSGFSVGNCFNVYFVFRHRK